MKKFIEENIDIVSLFPIVTTRSTGTVLEESFGLTVNHKTCSGPLGGDQEIGGMISLGELDGVLFFRDPLSAHPHDDDIKALMRICDVHCIPTANNPASGRAVVDYLAGVAARRADDIASGAATVDGINTRRAAAQSREAGRRRESLTRGWRRPRAAGAKTHARSKASSAADGAPFCTHSAYGSKPLKLLRAAELGNDRTSRTIASQLPESIAICKGRRPEQSRMANPSL